MQRLLTTLLGRLSVGRKLLLIFLLDMTAVAFVSGILVNEKYLSINVARKELAGNAYVAQLRGALLSTAGSASGAPAPSPDDVQQIRDAEQRWGHGMRSAELNLAFEQALLALRAQPGRADEQRRALERGRALLRRVSNQSNLILDPNLDSYYTMSLVVLRVPELLDAAAGMTRHVSQHDQRERGDAGARFLLLEGRFDSGRHALESDYAEALAAGDQALRQRLEPTHKRLLSAMDRYRTAAIDAMNEAAGTAPQSALAQAHQQLLAELDASWQATALALDGLLHQRIDGFFYRMALHLGTALALLGLILTAVYFVASHIARPLRRLAKVADDVSHTGDHTLRSHWNSHDEIGRLVRAFNDMLAQLDRERATQQELAASARAAQAQQQLVEAIPIPLMVTAVPGHKVLHANAPARAWLGDRDDDPWRRGLEPGVRARFFQQLADRDVVDEFEVRWRVGAEPSWAVLSARQLQFQGQSAVLTAFAPINHLKFMERRLELWAKVFEASGEGIVILDATRRVISINRAFCKSTGYELHELVGEPLQCIDGANHDLHAKWQGEVTVQRRDGTRYPAWMILNPVRDGHQGDVSHTIATTIDITDRKRNEERIHFLAQHDVLTELPNRSLCIERLRLAIQHAKRLGHKVAVLFIDLDRFKNINDSLGHHVGDALLRSVAHRLSDSVRAGDTVSRLGGDEFVVVLNGVADANEIVHIVDQRLVPRVREPHEIEGIDLQVSCSVGIAIYPDDANDIDTLMRHADVAMYQAKAQGRDGAHFFTPDLNDRVQQRMKLESNLRRALERDELQLHYQPRIDAHSGDLRGVEALLRWHSAELGAVPPARFIPIAEESGQIVDIGAWLIDEACSQLALWRAGGVDVPQVSVNVSALQLRDDGLIDTLRMALERHALPPGTVELELTESTLMDRAEQTLQRLQAIKRLGVELAIDDFGTGYSSLNYLKRFPIDRLKIDRSFVRDMFEDPTDLAITRAIIGLGHTLGLKVVAEGVESEREAQTLRAAGCDELQGYLIGRPVAADSLAHWMQQRRFKRA